MKTERKSSILGLSFYTVKRDNSSVCTTSSSTSGSLQGNLGFNRPA
jgi:hypothetical protein